MSKHRLPYISKARVKKQGLSCYDCGSNKRLQIHHKDKARENNNQKNLQCLCILCHADKHPINGYGMVNAILGTYKRRKLSTRQYKKDKKRFNYYESEDRKLQQRYMAMCGPVTVDKGE